MGRKIISALLSVILPIGGIIMLTSCKNLNENYTLSFVTTPLYADSNVESIPKAITLKDEYFRQSPTKFNKELALSSLTLSSTAYSYTHAVENLETMGFEHIAKFNYSDSYDENAVGIIIASKEFSDTTLVTILLRGTYKKEWYSNFDIGKNIANTKVHAGFSAACDYALEKLKMYMVNYGTDRDHCKFLVTGHSRGAAVANLMGKNLIDSYGPDNVYAYTFATPNTTIDENATDNHYSGIFNFINPEDFISYIPLESWGFTKYGTTIVFPENNGSDEYSEKLQRVSQYYEELKGRPFKTFGGTDSQNEFLSKAFELAPTIKDYYDTKYDIAGLKLSVYEYMCVVAHVLNDENLISNGLILLGSDDTVFEPFKNYIMSGMDIDNLDFELDYESSMIGYAHTAETYLAWLTVYIEDI